LPEPTPAIDVRGLSFRYGKGFAVQDLTLQVQRGEVFGYLGHNGAGKTTTVRILNGLLPILAGEAQVLGLPAATASAQIRARTGVLTETPSLDDRLTVQETLEYFGELYGVPRPELPGRIRSLLETLELGARAGERAGRLSKGLRQRLALARALLHAPDLLFLDEPTSGLDPVAAHQVHELVRTQRREGRTVFLCTHNLVEAQRLCDRLAVLDHGRILAAGTPAELAQRLGAVASVEFEIEPGDGPAAQAALQEFEGVTVEGARVRAPLPREAIPEALRRLTVASVRVYRVTPAEATLEDVYLSLYGRGAARPSFDDWGAS